MQFDREFEIPLDRPDARVVVRTGGHPVQHYVAIESWMQT